MVDVRHRISTVTFQLEIYKKLSQKLRQEVVVARDALATAKMQHLAHLNVFRKEASIRELQLEDSLAESGMAVRYHSCSPGFFWRICVCVSSRFQLHI